MSGDSFAVILYFSALGLGAFLARLGGAGWPGLRWYAGLLLIPLIALLLNVALLVPLTATCFIIAVAAVAGTAQEARRLIRERPPRASLLHPIVVLPLLYAVLGDRVYSPSQWDEFSHWLRMPREMLLVGREASRHMPFPGFADYTPGWPFLMLYPFALLGQPFATTPLLWLPLLSSIGVVGAVFDVLARLGATRSVAWVGCLFVGFVGFGANLTPTHLLSEPPLENAWAVMVLVALATGMLPQGNFLPAAGGIVMAGGYLLKKPFLAAAPLGLIIWTRSRTVDPTSSAGARWMGGALTLGPLAVAATIWAVATWRIPPTFVLPHGHLSVALAAPVLHNIVTALAEMLRDAAPAVLMCVVAVALSSWTRREHRAVVLVWLACAVLYLGGLFILYASAAFPDPLPATTLPGFYRYAGSLGRVAGFLGVVSICTELARRWRHSSRPRAAMTACLLILLASAVVRDALRWARTRPAPEGISAAYAPLIVDARRLRDAVEARGISPARLLVIAQEPAPELLFLRALLKYVSIEDGKGVAFRPIGRLPSLIPSDGGPYRASTTFTSPDAFEALLQRADVVWPIRTSPWMTPILARATQDGGCAGPFESYLLVVRRDSTDRGRFACIPLRVPGLRERRCLLLPPSRVSKARLHAVLLREVEVKGRRQPERVQIEAGCLADVVRTVDVAMSAARRRRHEHVSDLRTRVPGLVIGRRRPGDVYRRIRRVVHRLEGLRLARVFDLRAPCHARRSRSSAPA